MALQDVQDFISGLSDLGMDWYRAVSGQTATVSPTKTSTTQQETTAGLPAQQSTAGIPTSILLIVLLLLGGALFLAARARKGS